MTLSKESLNYSTRYLEIRNNPTIFYYRSTSNGDCGVFNQIFNDQSYNIERWKQGFALLKYQEELLSCFKNPLIIDAGANIGASTIFFKKFYKNPFVFAIEPEIGNFELLKLNTNFFDNIELFNGALSFNDTNLYLTDPNLSDWAFRTQEIQDSNDCGLLINSISPKTIIETTKRKGCTPFVFKIDIEGFESVLFRHDSSWLDKFPLVVIELHDWLFPFEGTSKSFLKAVLEFDFDFIPHNENIFLFNRKILYKYL